MGLAHRAILLLPIYLQSIISAPNRILIRPRIHGVFRDDPDQHLPVRAGSHGPLA